MVDRFLKYLEFEKRYSPHTITSYRTDLEQLTNFLLETFEIEKVEEIIHPHLRSWIVSLVEEGNSSRSINRKIATTKSYFKFLQGRSYVDKNPSGKLKPLKSEKRLPTFVSETDILGLLDNVEFGNEFEGIRDHLILLVFYSTGMRLSELINLKVMDVNTGDETVKVLGKRNKERIIPLPKSTVMEIKNYLKMRSELGFQNSESLFLTDHGDPLYPMWVYRLIKNTLGQVTTMSKRSPHVLRHTFATHLLDKGADLSAVKDLLGHSSLAATQVYTHNTLEKMKSAYELAHPRA